MDSKPIVFKHGQCLNCDTPITYGILCDRCTPADPPRTTTQKVTPTSPITKKEIKISEMQVGESGYTEEYAVFEASQKLYIILTARISPVRGGYKTVYIKRQKTHFEVDSRTIHPDDIYLGWPEDIDTENCTLAKLV